MSRIWVKVPEDVAETLVRSGDAEELRFRGASPTEVIQFVVEGVNTAAAIITLSRTHSSRRLAKALSAYAAGRAIRIVGTGNDPTTGSDQAAASPTPDAEAGRAQPTAAAPVRATLDEDAIVDVIEAKRPCD